MGTDRLGQLRAFYEEEPHDPFNIYALALEYLKSDEGKALDLFRQLMSGYPDYVPTYYHAGKLLEKMGIAGEALRVYQTGIEHCRKIGDAKALRELSSAYGELAADEGSS